MTIRILTCLVGDWLIVLKNLYLPLLLRRGTTQSEQSLGPKVCVFRTCRKWNLGMRMRMCKWWPGLQPQPHILALQSVHFATWPWQLSLFQAIVEVCSVWPTCSRTHLKMRAIFSRNCCCMLGFDLCFSNLLAFLFTCAYVSFFRLNMFETSCYRINIFLQENVILWTFLVSRNVVQSKMPSNLHSAVAVSTFYPKNQH